MRTIRTMAASLALAVMGLTGYAVAQGSSHLQTVLSQMDTASTKFQSAEAGFQWDFYERVTQSTSSQTGSIYFLRQKGATQMGARIEQPSLKFLSYDNGVLQVYDPTANTLIHIQAHGNQSAQYESFLTLGFGGSGHDLAQSWNITDQGMETINGVSCAKLDLVSKDQNVKNMFTHVTIWVDLSRGISLQQKFFTPSDDVRTAIYKQIKYNQRVDKKPYSFKTNSKTQVTNR